ncbi:DUF4365 domain-containing protein [Gloeobacter kilaueensis]|uniref:DUF4365 domain-containing protein n=1 Tax=Gloeobacter kilaueensis (strain ATCC BAA-2537 / CCAP 1431/1 / ULC 316 / JS1) TaxID=1183438 RepID=U5QGE4_GLOK1|nr:DUF4365 domain-containing protein [Gloeobacter kilaueensis]AGY57938.1 hypothetical protein GKIL_1692 [Gloeobacter kilaueensis JS1]
MSPKKISQNSISGQQGINYIEKVVLSMGHLWNPSGGVEAGIDGYIEFRNSATNEVTNLIVQVQSKTWKNKFTAETDDKFEWTCDAADIDYWMQGNAPVILVVIRLESEEAYWVSIKDRFTDQKARQKRKIYFDKNKDKFDISSALAIEALAIDPKIGIYFSPAKKSELLYSNLLRVDHIGPSIFAAATRFSSVRAINDQLIKCNVRKRQDWLLEDNTIFSFFDPSSNGYENVCDLTTMEEFDVAEWSTTDSPEKYRQFIQLLNSALRERVDDEVGFLFRKGIFYFRPTPDLAPREFKYKATQNITSREVFKGYSRIESSQKTTLSTKTKVITLAKETNSSSTTTTSKSESEYYRHSAFIGQFQRYDGEWYLEIEPTYRFTKNGYLPLPNAYEKLRKIKEIEKNLAVFRQVVMWARYLQQQGSLLNPEYSYLKFGDLMRYESEFGIDDGYWRSTADEDEDESKSSSDAKLIDENQLKLDF